LKIGELSTQLNSKIDGIRGSSTTIPGSPNWALNALGPSKRTLIDNSSMRTDEANLCKNNVNLITHY